MTWHMTLRVSRDVGNMSGGWSEEKEKAYEFYMWKGRLGKPVMCMSRVGL